MESCGKENDFVNNLIFILKKITKLSTTKVFDDIYFEHLLCAIQSETSKELGNILNSAELLECLSDTSSTWKTKLLDSSIASFFCQFIGVLSKTEEGFRFMLKINVLEELADAIKLNHENNSAVKVAFIKFLFYILNHNYGYFWIKTTQEWKLVLKWYLSKCNLFVEREGLIFFKKLFTLAKSDDCLTEEIIQELLQLINFNNELIFQDKSFCLKLILSLKLLETFLKMYSVSESRKIYQQITQKIDIENFFKLLLGKCDHKCVIDAVGSLYSLFIVSKVEDKKSLLSTNCMPAELLEIFYVLLNKTLIESVIKLAKFCQILWCEIRKELNCDNTTGVHFIIIQLVPALIYNRKPPNTRLFDFFLQKLFVLTSESTKKFCYCLRDVIRTNFEPKYWAVKSVLSAVENTENLMLDEAVIIFQSIAYVVSAFVPVSKCDEQIIVNENLEMELLLCADDSLLSAALNALCIIIKKFKINWTESLESLCLLKMTCDLLQIISLSSIVVVQTLLLVRLVILNFMSPNLALLLNKTEGSSFECLMPLLYKQIHNSNWEVRDSCIEVITAITDLAEFKYPAFQKLLIEHNFCSLIFDIMENDSESYVRASALRALSAMTKIKPLNQCLKDLNFSLKIVKLLQTESEGIVRVEAALIIKQLYVSQNECPKVIDTFYHTMGYTALCDLHWEVKVNSLCFWEAVILQVITDQGMIDGSFPKVTFSKEHKKIVRFTSEEIKARLDKVLRELSRIGCLYVLLSTLYDDCDFPVVQKSVQILTDFIAILKKYNLIKFTDSSSACDRITKKKRKNTKNSYSKKQKPSDADILVCVEHNNIKEPFGDSEAVIEEIVNEMDINLLVSVYHCAETNTLEKKFFFKEINPEDFLMQIQNFNFEKFLEEKQKWLMNTESDLKLLVNNLSIENSANETNVMDCY